MRAAVLAICLLPVFAPAAFPQVFLGAEVSPGSFLKDDPGGVDTSGEDAFSWALSVEVSSETLYSVFRSTTPEREMLKYLRSGIYRQELAAIVLLSGETSVPAKTLVEELPKAGGLRGLAKKHKVDAMSLFRRSERLKAAADYRMPLFLPPPSVSSPTASVPVSTGAPANVP